jgi:DNA-binding CsgD family transcriptional regulator
VIERVRELLKRTKHTSEKSGRVSSKSDSPGIPTPYGKKLMLSDKEKLGLAESLTPREKDAFFLLLEGYTLKETAAQMGIGYSTANTYQTAIYRKLHVNSRAELIINYRSFGRPQAKEP